MEDLKRELKVLILKTVVKVIIREIHEDLKRELKEFFTIPNNVYPVSEDLKRELKAFPPAVIHSSFRLT
jgi:hypothetical protein